MRSASFAFASLYLSLALAFAQSPASRQQAGVVEQPAATPPGIARFIKLDQGVYRGGQPSEKGFEALKSMGIRTVVNFRDEKDERERVERLGMKYVYIPLNARRGIPDEAIRRFFDVVADRQNHPVFFHCRRGADRTGAMAGFYRVMYQGWDGKAAAQEARRVGMRWWYGNLKKQVETFDPAKFGAASR